MCLSFRQKINIQILNISNLALDEQFINEHHLFYRDINFKKFHDIKDAVRTYYGRKLLYYFFRKNNIDEKLLILQSNAKPYIKNNIYYFSISHSGHYVVLATSKQSVGIDIQVKKDIDYESIMNRFFSLNERKLINNSSIHKDEFYRIWSCKEALVKAIDIDSCINAQHTEILKDKQNKYKTINNINSQYFFSCKEVNNYQLAICSSIKRSKITISNLFYL